MLISGSPADGVIPEILLVLRSCHGNRGSAELLARVQLPAIGHLHPRITEWCGFSERVGSALGTVSSFVVDAGPYGRDVDDGRRAAGSERQLLDRLRHPVERRRLQRLLVEALQLSLH